MEELMLDVMYAVPGHRPAPSTSSAGPTSRRWTSASPCRRPACETSAPGSDRLFFTSPRRRPHPRRLAIPPHPPPVALTRCPVSGRALRDVHDLSAGADCQDPEGRVRDASAQPTHLQAGPHGRELMTAACSRRRRSAPGERGSPSGRRRTPCRRRIPAGVGSWALSRLRTRERLDAARAADRPGWPRSTQSSSVRFAAARNCSPSSGERRHSSSRSSTPRPSSTSCSADRSASPRAPTDSSVRSSRARAESRTSNCTPSAMWRGPARRRATTRTARSTRMWSRSRTILSPRERV